MTILVKDVNGAVRDWAWLVAQFGQVQVVDDPHGEFEVVEFRESIGPATLVCYLQDLDGAPLGEQMVAFWWPDVGQAEDARAGAGRHEVAIPVWTKQENGAAEFSMGKGAYYNPAVGQVGPHELWPWGDNGPAVIGLGMIGGTEHRCLHVIMRPRSGDTPPPPPEPPEPPAGGSDDIPRFFDDNDNERDLAWAEQAFGPQEVHRPEAANPSLYPVWELVELRCEGGEGKVLGILLLDETGRPAQGVQVALGPRDVEGIVLRDRTGPDGYAHIAMGEAHRHGKGSQGHYACAVMAEGASHVYNSAGWVRGTEQWLEPVFRRRLVPRDQPATYHLAVGVEGQGQVAVSPNLAEYPGGTLVTLAASAAAGWRFERWSGAIAGSGNPATLSMKADAQVKAHFAPDNQGEDPDLEAIRTKILEAKARLAAARAEVQDAEANLETALDLLGQLGG